jgi:general secretion pathway protein I
MTHPLRGSMVRQQGFSLLEVVVAFAILALTLGVLMQIFSRALNTTALSGEYSRAATLAEARLNTVGIDIPLEAGSYTGDPEDGIAWQVFIEPYQPGEVTWEPTLDAFRVTAVASWGGDRVESRREVSLSTLRLGESSDIPGLTPQGAPQQVTRTRAPVRGGPPR